MSMEKTTTGSGLPAFEHKFLNKGVPCSRFYVRTAELDQLSIDKMNITNFRNHTPMNEGYEITSKAKEAKSKHNDWVTRIGLTGDVHTLPINMFFNYYKGLTGIRKSVRGSLVKSEEFQVSPVEIHDWYKDTEAQFKKIYMSHCVKGSCGRAKRPLFYTAGLFYQKNKGYAVNAASLLMLSEDNMTIIKEVMKIGNFFYEHIPVKSDPNTTIKIKKKGGKRGETVSTTLCNSYAYCVYKLKEQDLEDSLDWGDWDDEIENVKSEDSNVVHIKQVNDVSLDLLLEGL